MEKYDFLAIGDITNDAFIKLDNQSARSFLNSGNTELCLNFGEKLPYEFVKEINAVGNASNACVTAKKLGLKTAIVTDLGNDENGKKCLKKLKENSISIEFVKTHQNIKTNYNFVLWFDQDRTILVKHENYPFKLPEINPPRWIYLTSLAENTEDYYKEIENYLNKNPEINLAFQPGTFQIKMNANKLSPFYKRANLFVVNKNEAKNILQTKDDNIKTLLSKIKDLGPKIVVITDGKNGAYMLDQDKIYFVPIFNNNKEKIDGTGSGDAFSATMASFLALGKTPEEAFLLAPINSSFVLTEIGAQDGLLTRDEIENYYKNAPENYKIQEI